MKNIIVISLLLCISITLYGCNNASSTVRSDASEDVQQSVDKLEATIARQQSSSDAQPKQKVLDKYKETLNTIENAISGQTKNNNKDKTKLLDEYKNRIVTIESSFNEQEKNKDAEEKAILDKYINSLTALNSAIGEQIESGNVEQDVVDNYEKLAEHYEKLID